MKTRRVIYSLAVLIILPLLFSSCRGTVGVVEPGMEIEAAREESARRLWEEGQSRQARGEYRRALRAYRELVGEYPGSTPAPEAQFRIGVCLEKLDRLYRAFQAYQTLLEDYPGQGELGEILRRQYEIGEAYLEGRKRWFLFLRIRSGLDRAAEIFRTVVNNATFSPVAPRAQYGLARSLELRGRNLEAILEYEQVLVNYPGSEVFPSALFGLGACHYREARRADYDQREVDEALRHLRRFVNSFPDHPRRSGAEEMIGNLRDRRAKKAYDIARYYQRRGSVTGARLYYREVVDNYPDSKYAESARKKLEKLDEE